jgi:hypothetical protein
MSKTKLGEVIERIHRAVSPTYDAEARAYEQAYPPVEAQVKLCRNVNPTTPRLLELKQQVDNAEQTRARQVAASDYAGALVTVRQLSGATAALLAEAKSQVQDRLGFEKVHTVLKPQVTQAKLLPTPNNALQDLKKRMTDAETDLEETVKEGVKDYATANKTRLPALVNALKAFTDASKKFTIDKGKYETAANDLMKPGGLLEKAKALDTPSVVLRDLKQQLLDAEKAVTDELKPGVLNYEAAESKLPTLQRAITALTDARKTHDENKRAWDALDADYKETQTKLADLKTWEWSAEPALKQRMNVIEQAVKDGDFKTAKDNLPALKSDVAAAHPKAKAKKDCLVEYNKVVDVYEESNNVPELNPTLKGLIEAKDKAYSLFLREYKAGRYDKATPLLANVKRTSEAVMSGAMSAAVESRPEISPEQEERARGKLAILYAKSPKDHQEVEALLAKAPTKRHKQNLQKAIAAGHSAAEIKAFNDKIKGKDEKWLQDNLHITASSTGTGVQQQWVMSCQATTAQAVKAELDPIYALKLHEENPEISQLAPSDTIPMATEQKEWLESAPDEEVNDTYLGKVNTRASTETPEVVAAFQKLLDDAQSNWEKNQLLEVMGRPQNYSPEAITNYYNSDIKDKGPRGGEAVHKTVLNSPSHRGRRGVDLLNKNKDVTGLKYETKMVDSSTREAAVDDIANELALGRPVPLSVGENDGELRHYVLAVSVHAGPPKTFFIHDPARGTTVARTEEQMKTNKLDLPSGWTRLNKYEKPSPA